jgi:hypothetical protein
MLLMVEYTIAMPYIDTRWLINSLFLLVFMVVSYVLCSFLSFHP